MGWWAGRGGPRCKLSRGAARKTAPHKQADRPGDPTSVHRGDRSREIHKQLHQSRKQCSGSGVPCHTYDTRARAGQEVLASNGENHKLAEAQSIATVPHAGHDNTIV